MFSIGSVTLRPSPVRPSVRPSVRQLTKLHLEAQRVERELRDQLAESVSRATSDADRARVAELEKAEAELRVEASR